MSHDFHSSRHELSRLYNHWEKFTHRDEKKHHAENSVEFRLGRPRFLITSTPPTSNSPPKTSAEVIEVFLTYGSHRLNDPVPRQRQLLKDFFQAADPVPSMLSSEQPSTTYYDDVKLRSSISDIALLDDRNNHPRCARKIGKACSDCYILSKKVSIPDLCTHLQGEVSMAERSFPSIIATNTRSHQQRKTQQGTADRRIL
jgi:hypothetical protein